MDVETVIYYTGFDECEFYVKSLSARPAIKRSGRHLQVPAAL